MLFLECALLGMQPSWNVPFLECDQNGICFNGMHSFWNVLKIECAVHLMECFLNVFFLEYAHFGMCPFWNVIKMELAQN